MKTVFLDRDGVINRYPGDTEYVKSWEEFHFLPRVKSSLKRLDTGGIKIFIISNQAGVAKGIYSRKALQQITANMLQELKPAHIEGTYYCTHRSEDNCSCRKPKTGLIKMAMDKMAGEGFKIEHARSYLIGDTISDIQAGKAAGLKTILVFSGKEKPENEKNWQERPDFTCPDLSQAVKIILKK